MIQSDFARSPCSRRSRRSPCDRLRNWHTERRRVLSARPRCLVANGFRGGTSLLARAGRRAILAGPFLIHETWVPIGAPLRLYHIHDIDLIVTRYTRCLPGRSGTWRGDIDDFVSRARTRDNRETIPVRKPTPIDRNVSRARLPESPWLPFPSRVSADQSRERSARTRYQIIHENSTPPSPLRSSDIRLHVVARIQRGVISESPITEFPRIILG